MDGPETGECCHARDAGKSDVVDEERERPESDASEGECPPAFLAEIVFRLDDYRMEQSYYEKGRQTYDYA